MKSVDLMSLWNPVCSVLLYTLWEREHWRIVVGSSFSHKGHFFLSQSAQSSLSIFAHSFEPTEGLRHTEVTEAFQLRLAVTFCEIGWLNVSVEYRVFCSSVFSVRKRTSLRLAGEYFLSQSSQILQNLFAHNFELTERLRHTDITERYS